MNCRTCFGGLWIPEKDDWIKCPDCNATGDDNANVRLADVFDFESVARLRNRSKREQMDQDDPSGNAT